jgi:hypothetical protein
LGLLCDEADTGFLGHFWPLITAGRRSAAVRSMMIRRLAKSSGDDRTLIAPASLRSAVCYQVQELSSAS